MGIFKRMIREGNTEAIEVTENKEVYQDLRERMEMKSYISFEDVRKHLVEMIEENKELREENDRLRRERDERRERYKKTAELAQISADEYKSQLREVKKKTQGWSRSFKKVLKSWKKWKEKEMQQLQSLK